MDDKKCESCKYFIMYYINHKGLYKPLKFGHCVREKVLANRKKQIYCNHVCEFWESNQEKKQAKFDSIKHTLCRMADDLNNYLMTLNEEKRQ